MRVPLSWRRHYVELPFETQRSTDLLANLGCPVDGLERRPLITGVVIGKSL